MRTSVVDLGASGTERRMGSCCAISHVMSMPVQRFTSHQGVLNHCLNRHNIHVQCVTCAAAAPYNPTVLSVYSGLKIGAQSRAQYALAVYSDLTVCCLCLFCCSTYDPTVLSVYSGLKTAVERSDLWRYVVMCKHGGVYTDADTLCVRPIQVSS
jgi:hypothetical protein